MTAQDLITALDLPQQALVDQRVPKKLLIENGIFTAADKRLIQDSIEDLTWVAALKPETIGVPAYRDEVREYLELAILTLRLRSTATARLAELVHRAIPYPVLLIVASTDDIETSLTVSLANIRWAQREADRTVLDDPFMQASIPTSAIGQAFAQAMALPNQPRTHLLDLYQGWIDTTAALQAAEITGQFSRSISREQAIARHAALLLSHTLKARITALRKAATKEKQIQRQVAINAHIKRISEDLAQAKATLK